MSPNCDHSVMLSESTHGHLRVTIGTVDAELDSEDAICIGTSILAWAHGLTGSSEPDREFRRAKYGPSTEAVNSLAVEGGFVEMQGRPEPIVIGLTMSGRPLGMVRASDAIEFGHMLVSIGESVDVACKVFRLLSMLGGTETGFPELVTKILQKEIMSGGDGTSYLRQMQQHRERASDTPGFPFPAPRTGDGQ